MLDILAERHLLVPRGDDPTAEDANHEAPKDNRAKVVAELVETERKYVQYLEILQVCWSMRRGHVLRVLTGS